MNSGCTGGSLIAFDTAVRRKPAAENAAFANFALDFEYTFVPQEYVLDDRQPETSATRFTGSSGIHAVESFGQARDMVGCDPHARVLDRENRVSINYFPVYYDMAARRRISNRIENQVGKGAVKL